MKELKFSHVCLPPTFLITYTLIPKPQSFSTYMERCYEERQSQEVQVSINKNSFYFICILFWKP